MPLPVRYPGSSCSAPLHCHSARPAGHRSQKARLVIQHRGSARQLLKPTEGKRLTDKVCDSRLQPVFRDTCDRGVTTKADGLNAHAHGVFPVRGRHRRRRRRQCQRRCRLSQLTARKPCIRNSGSMRQRGHQQSQRRESE